MFTKKQKLRESCLKSPVVILLFTVLVSNTAFGQWKRIATFPFTAGVVYFQHKEGHPEVGFVGTWITEPSGNRDFPAQLLKTTDAGVTWRDVADPSWKGAIRNIFFTDALNGWVALGSVSNSAKLDGGCFGTRDGGETWFFLNGTSGHCSSVYFNATFNLLLINYWADRGIPPSLLSTDDGMTFQSIPLSENSNGFAFWDSQNGLLTRVGVGSKPDGPFLITSDGGFSWRKSLLEEESWQPLAVPGTTIAFALCDITKKLYRSDDFGFSWTLIHQFVQGEWTSGCIAGNLKKLYVQTQSGIYTSIDSGQTWSWICGSPAHSVDQRFQVVGDTVIAFNVVPSLEGSSELWLNTSGKGVGPRLQIEKDKGARTQTVFGGDIFPMDIYYSKEAYSESVDSLSFTIRSADPVNLLSDSVATGWSVIRSIDTNNVITYWLKRTDVSAPPLDSFLIRLYFQATVAPEKTALLTLDEINFNNDVTFRDCMVASLTANDSFQVNILDKCGDSTIREFLRGNNLPLKIISLRPNPAQNEVAVELDAAEDGVAMMEVYDELGNWVMSREISFAKGRQRVTISTADLPEGMYSVRLGGMSGRFVKVN